VNGTDSSPDSSRVPTEDPPGPPSVDVLVVTWNTCQLSVQALQRVVGSEQGARLRMLVHDNGSTDDTAAAIRRALPAIDVEAGTSNIGFAAGVNSLLARSSAPWLLLLNSDAWPEPGCVGELVAVAERHPQAAAVAARLEDEDGRLEVSTHPFPSIWLALRTALGIIGRVPDIECRVDWATGAALLLRREALRDVGRFDETYFMYGEDLEWCWRASRAGWQVWLAPGAIVRHVGNASGAQAYGERRAAVVAANAYRFYRSTHGPLSTTAYRMLNVLGATRRWLWSAARGDPGLTTYWRNQVRAHLRPAGPSELRPDG
jgi:N-acetylglucosaminyl-diphospho-decaprenol L-rhamnosyltransferase